VTSDVLALRVGYDKLNRQTACPECAKSVVGRQSAPLRLTRTTEYSVM
jgi:hypothetical protein